MISIALIIISLVLIFTGKMPLVGGKAMKGQNVRIGGLLMLALTGGSIFVATRISLLLNLLVIISVIGVYFFVKGDVPDRDEEGLFTSEAEEKKTYSQAISGLLIAIAMMILFVVGIFLLLMIIRGG